MLFRRVQREILSLMDCIRQMVRERRNERRGERGGGGGGGEGHHYPVASRRACTCFMVAAVINNSDLNKC